MLDREGFKKKLGERIRKAREEKGISQKEIEAMDGGIERQMISRFERGVRMPEAYTLYRLSRLLDINLTDLLKDFDRE